MSDLFRDFSQRIETYTVMKWFIKSKKISPQKCAQWGFINCDLNTLKCSFCNAKLKYQNNSDSEEYIGLFINQMREIHDNDCFFKHAELFKVTRQMIFLEWDTFFSDNLGSFQGIDLENIQLPKINPIFLQKLPVHIQSLMVTDESCIDKIKVFLHQKKVFSIFGWKLVKQNSQKKMLSCQFCGRRVPIDSYDCSNELLQPLDQLIEQTFQQNLDQQRDPSNITNVLLENNMENQNNTTNENKFLIEAQSISENNIINQSNTIGYNNPSVQINESKYFNVLDEHRYYCKWGKIDTQSHKIYGWNICANMLYDKIKSEKGTGKSIFERKNEIQKIKYELLKSIDDIKRNRNETLNKINQIEEKAQKYNLENIDLLKSKMQERRVAIDILFQEVQDNLEIPIKKNKIN